MLVTDNHVEEVAARVLGLQGVSMTLLGFEPRGGGSVPSGRKGYACCVRRKQKVRGGEPVSRLPSLADPRDLGTPSCLQVLKAPGRVFSAPGVASPCGSAEGEATCVDASPEAGLRLERGQG